MFTYYFVIEVKKKKIHVQKRIFSLPTPLYSSILNDANELKLIHENEYFDNKFNYLLD